VRFHKLRHHGRARGRSLPYPSRRT
jgi:hypothetical protein